MRCGIIGAGLAALTCAGELKAAGCEVRLFDKGRGPGGRMSTRRLTTSFGAAELDHGAPYFEVSDPGFRRIVEEWRREGLVVPWREAGPRVWTGFPRMSSLISGLAARHDVSWQTFVGGLIRNDGAWQISTDQGLQGPFDVVVTAVPPEQAIPFLALHDLDMARTAAQAKSRACWTGMFVFRDQLAVSPYPRRGNAPLDMVLCNRAKPGRAGPESWVVHATPEWSAAHLERDPAEVAPLLLAALKDLLELPALPPVEAIAHRWRYAMSDGIGRSVLWNRALKLGACGDWLPGIGVEGAWLSGRNLAHLVMGSGRQTGAGLTAALRASM